MIESWDFHGGENSDCGLLDFNTDHSIRRIRAQRH